MRSSRRREFADKARNASGSIISSGIQQNCVKPHSFGRFFGLNLARGGALLRPVALGKDMGHGAGAAQGDGHPSVGTDLHQEPGEFILSMGFLLFLGSNRLRQRMELSLPDSRWFRMRW